MAAIAPTSTMANAISSASTSPSASSPLITPGTANTALDANGTTNGTMDANGTDPTTPRRKLSISTTNLPTNLSGARTFDLPRETDTPRNPTTARRASHSQGQRPEKLANVAPPAQLNGALPRNGEREGGSDCTAWCVVV